VTNEKFKNYEAAARQAGLEPPRFGPDNDGGDDAFDFVCLF
jgi:hypothetical protein